MVSNILVADRDPLWSKSVIGMLRKNFNDVKFVGMACSGKEAIEKAIAYHPDLIITDIDFPGIDGFEMIQQIKQNHSNIDYVIFSACDSFEYAVKAMRLEVQEYLLKPMKEEKFVQAMGRILQKQRIKQACRHQTLAHQERLAMVRPLLEMSFIKALSDVGDNPEELKKCCDALGYHNCEGYVMVLTVDVSVQQGKDIKGNAVSQEQKEYREYKRILESMCDCIVGFSTLNRMIVFVFTDQTETDLEHKSESIDMAQNFIRRAKQYDQKMRLGIGGACNSVCSAKDSYWGAVQALEEIQRIKQDSPEQAHVLHIEDVSSTERLSFDDQLKTMLEQMGYLDEEAEQKLFQQLYTTFRNNGDRLDWLIDQMVIFALAVQKKWKISVTETGSIITQVTRTEQAEKALHLMEYWLDGIIRRLKKNQQHKYHFIIEQANCYMEQHYAEQITLEDISREVNLSTYYFSRFYKEETGVNFIDKLSSIRIEKAKEILKNQSVSVKDVSYMVGYLEPTYFSKIFKKMTGYTAGEYKRLLET